MDHETVKSKMKVEVDRVVHSRLAGEFGWKIEVTAFDAFVHMSPRHDLQRRYLLRVNFDDFPRQAPSYVFVDQESLISTSDSWPPKVKFSQAPDGICVAGTRECHSHYHKNDATYRWDPTKWPFISTLEEIHRLMELGCK